jgi:hypothetical protein
MAKSLTAPHHTAQAVARHSPARPRSSRKPPPRPPRPPRPPTRTTTTTTTSAPSCCCQRSWRVFFRYCCCTAGWYPALVAPLVTIACLLSLYSSAGCDYIDLSVGFVPSNAAVLVTLGNHSTEALHLGFFFHYYHVEEEVDEPQLQNVHQQQETTTRTSRNPYREIFHEGCVRYDAAFEESIIGRDRTWRVGRIIAMIAGGASLVALVTVWLILLLPTPIGCAWPTLLLPATMLSFIAEGSKFLIFDAAVCRNAMWYPSGVDSLPEIAENCTIGSSAYFGIAAAVLHFISLLCVCLNAPEKRKLDPDFGIIVPFDCDDDDNELFPDDENSTEAADFAADTVDGGPHTFYSSDPSPSSTRIEGMNASIGSLTPDTTHSEPGGYINTTSVSNSRRTPVSAAVPVVSSSSSYHSPAKAQKQREEDHPAPLLPMPPATTEQHVSESRLAVISKMSFSHPSSEDMIAQLCSELDQSLA